MSKLIRNITSFSGAIIVQKVISFFYFTFLARSLGPSLAGAYFLGLSLFQIFLAFSDLGMMNYLIRETSQDQRGARKLFGYFYGLRGILAALSYAGLVVAAFLLHYPKDVIAVALIGGTALFFDTFTYLNYGVLRGHQNLRSESIGVIVFQGVLVFAGALIVFFTKSIVLLAVSLALASLANFLFSLWSLRKHTSFAPRFQFEKSRAWTIIKNSLPFALIVIFSRLYTQTDIVMLSKIGCAVRDCPLDLGLYTVAVKATLVIQSLPISFMASIYPALSELFVANIDQCRVLFQNTLRYLLAAICAIAVVFTVYGDSAVRFVWGADYAGSVTPIVILLLGSIFVIGTYPLGSLLNSAWFQKQYALYTLIALLSNIVLNVITIPRWGMIGAAWSSLGGSAILFLLSSFKIREALSKPFQGFTHFIVALVGSSLAAFAISKGFFSGWNFVVGSILTVFIYTALMLLTKAIDMSHVKTFFRSFRSFRSSKPNTQDLF